MNGGGLSIVYWRPSGLIVTSSHAESATAEDRANHHAAIKYQFVPSAIRGSLSSSDLDLSLSVGNMYAVGNRTKIEFRIQGCIRFWCRRKRFLPSTHL